MSGSALETRLAWLLGAGTWTGAMVIAAGMGLGLLGMPAHAGSIELAGIALIIALPILRVAVMCSHYFAAGDRRFGFIAAAVLVIIAAGIAIGMVHR